MVLPLEFESCCMVRIICLGLETEHWFSFYKVRYLLNVTDLNNVYVKWWFPHLNGVSDIVGINVISLVLLTFMNVSYVNVSYVFDDNRNIINDKAQIILEQKKLSNT